MTNILGIDLGEKRIGLAVGSLETRLARPLQVIDHVSRKSDIERILHVAKLETISVFVIGISYQEDGQPNSMGRHAISFGTDLQASGGVPVEYCDEALSTRDARMQAIETGLSKKSRRGHLDSSAAAIILQSYLDALPNQP
jgi:putative holliday junction resolvase